MNKIQIAPSILSADFTNINKAITTIESCDLSLVHLDVMDGAFVPNITFGPKFIKDMRPLTELTFDCHLMVDRPERFIPEFVQAGADMITIHLESTLHINRVLQMIKDSGVKVGISIIPSTPVSLLLPILDMVDLVLVMTVNPGFGGQKLIQSCLNKVAELKAIREEEDYQYLISVDGGVNLKTIEDVVAAGADIAVMGSAFFNAEDSVEFLKQVDEVLA